MNNWVHEKIREIPRGAKKKKKPQNRTENQTCEVPTNTMAASRERCLKEQGSRVGTQIRGPEMRRWAPILPKLQSSGSAHPAKVGLDPWNFSRQDARIRTMKEIGYHHYQGHRRGGKGDIGRPDWHIHTAAAAAKSLQSCPTLYDPRDGNPPGSPVPGILQAGTLEWVASSFSNAWKWKVKVKALSCVWL